MLLQREAAHLSHKNFPDIQKSRNSNCYQGLSSFYQSQHLHKDLHNTPDATDACFSQEPITQGDLGEDYAPDLQDTLENTLQESLGKIHQDIQAHSSRLEELEQRVMLLENDNEILHDDLKTTTNKIGVLEDRLEDMENCSRPSNLRVVGLPESVKYTSSLRSSPHCLSGKSVSSCNTQLPCWCFFWRIL